ncbi:phospholipase D family protein [Pseudomonas nunensis]|uniref:phospholipase D family protein n=1 Tax=Pseudomonas nunensis TaxID=2961896 RepID=UPI0025B23E53|nr:phospholipase D family protein [Pseudomonas nunensis]MDN3224174.1 phospholipase D family protein [Pseudomonas nunensis]
MTNSGIYTNSPGQDQVLRPYTVHMGTASSIRIAVPYFTRASEILQAAARGARIELLVGLNRSTDPSALRSVLNSPNCLVRYFTDRYHAKVFLFDGVAMLGSANLTGGGMASNREATLVLDQPGDEERILELELFFAQVWDSAEVLTPQILKQFKDAWDKSSRLGNPDAPFQMLRSVEPPTVLSGSGRKSAQQYVLSGLQKLIYGEYRPAFAEVSDVLRELGLRRPEFVGFDPSVETNRFLNWVRLEHAVGEASWQEAQQRPEKDRRYLVRELATQWVSTMNTHIPDDYFQLLTELRTVMGTPESIRASNHDQLARALICVHAFKQQLRFTLGGEEALPTKFWQMNHGDLQRVQNSLINLVHGTDDFAERICAVLYDERYKLGAFGRFCTLELVGTLKPEQVPPINGRMAKALRFLGFNVRPS